MAPAKLPVSLVVTVKNDAAALRCLLVALEQQTVLPAEVVLTVAKSNDQTLDTAQSWRPDSVQVRVVSLPSANRSIGRNYGVKVARHDLIIFTDAGCVPEPNWLKKLITPFSDPRIKLVSGYTVGDAQNAWEEAQAPFVLVPLAKVEPRPLPATRNMAVRRAVFAEQGGFRPDLNYAEDFELARRWRSAGIEATFVPEAIVRWRPRATIGGFFRMIANLTAGDIQAGIIRPGLVSVWLRYLFLIIVFGWWPPVGLVLYGSYLALKMARSKFSRKITYLAAMGLQICGDLAVLAGSVLGLSRRLMAITVQ